MVLEYDFDIVVNEQADEDTGSEQLDQCATRARFDLPPVALATQAFGATPTEGSVFSRCETKHAMPMGRHAHDITQRSKVLVCV